MAAQRVLLVEDSPSVHAVVQSALDQSCELTWVADLKAARLELATQNFALILLDVHLPDGDGFEFCAELRADPRLTTVGIMFLTGETEVAKRVHGFDIGADDYLTKPFAPAELAARVGARLRHHRTARDGWQVEDFRIDLNGQRASLVTDETATELPLTPIEFKLLTQFLKNIDQVISRENLIKAVWGESVHVALHTVDTHISSLRKKIGPHGERLNAVVKRGYCFRSVTADRAQRRHA